MLPEDAQARELLLNRTSGENGINQPPPCCMVASLRTLAENADRIARPHLIARPNHGDSQAAGTAVLPHKRGQFVGQRARR